MFQLKSLCNLIYIQLLSFTNAGELRIEENCAEVDDEVEGKLELSVIMAKCHGKGENQKWTHKRVQCTQFLL